MLQQIIENYGDFGDALITEFHYDSGRLQNGTKKSCQQLEIFISCFNSKSGNNDKIKVTCKGVEYFRTNGADRMIYGALVSDNGAIITLDFFPIIISRDQLKEDPNSDFIVKSKEVFYELLNNAIR